MALQNVSAPCRTSRCVHWQICTRSLRPLPPCRDSLRGQMTCARGLSAPCKSGRVYDLSSGCESFLMTRRTSRWHCSLSSHRETCQNSRLQPTRRLACPRQLVCLPPPRPWRVHGPRQQQALCRKHHSAIHLRRGVIRPPRCTVLPTSGQQVAYRHRSQAFGCTIPPRRLHHRGEAAATAATEAAA